MAKILSNKKSTGGSPYAYYSVEATNSNRSTSSVDITVKVTSNLQYSSSSLGSGGNFGLIGYITLNNTEYSMTLKATNVTWKGTGKHTTTSTFNVNAPGSQEELKNIKFRVSRTGSYANDYSRGAALSSTTCNNISIGIGHTPPSNVDFYLEETSEKVINASVPETTYVKTLSNKRVTMAYTLHDEATASKYGIQDKYNTYVFNTNPFIIDGSAIKDEVGNKITFKTFVIDSMGGTGYSNSIVYDYIDYNSVNLIETSTTAKRDGQTSGKVKLNINGTFYNGSIGNITQTKPTIKYKFWKLKDTEPVTFDNTIPSNSINVTGNNFAINNYEIGSTDETASNYFNPNNAYRIKIFVQDTFTTYTSSEKSVPIGEATWSEYKDRVDFKKITIQGKDIISNIIYANNKILWGPDYYYMVGSNTINLSQKVSEQKTGIVLMWQAYVDGKPQSYDLNYTFVPKHHTLVFPAGGVTCWLSNSSGNIVATKYVYVYDDKIQGNDINGLGSTTRSGSGITFTNNYWVLTYVIGV